MDSTMPPKLVGFVDWFQSNRICGWARDRESPRCVSVEVLCDERPVAVVPCTGNRPDLLQFYKTANHGFTFDLPPSYRKDGLPHKITVRFSDTQATVPSLVGELVTQPHEDLLLRELRATTYQRGLWQLDGVAFQDGCLSIQGWWLPPRLLPGVTPTFYVNQTPFEVCHLSARADIASLMDMDIDDQTARFGFHCRIPLEGVPAADGVYRFQIGYDVFPERNTEEQDFYFLTGDLPLPEDVRRQRIGQPSEDAFHVAGGTIYAKMQQTLRSRFGKGYDDFASILDWGCGCGRVLRHFVARTKTPITGIEIDRDNLRWCSEHYPSAVFREGRLEPPLDLPADSFDLIFGISVFTHLSEEMQHAWLAELRRITRPGGLVLMTVVGDVGWFRNRFSLAQFQAWKTTGFIDVGSDTILDGQIGRTEYYRLVYHDAAYVLRQWRKHFRIVDLIPGHCNCYQDLVVMQKC
jgi:SAM-dependent methyltransferase